MVFFIYNQDQIIYNRGRIIYNLTLIIEIVRLSPFSGFPLFYI